jgi:predicted lipoprotein with Yx(FWY)xxD motif
VTHFRKGYARFVPKGWIRLATGVVGVLLLAGGCGSAGTASTPPSAVPPTIEASSTPQFQGQVLTDSGFALYVFQPDAGQRATCKGTCAVVWPPVLVARDQQATAGPGVQASLLGTDPYSSTQSVVTYKGWPLYLYKNDTVAGSAAGQASNVNGGYWYAIGTDGVPIVPPGDPAAY